ncbi:MAG: hypothetical protein U5L10_04280 [Candidatus Moranbacteria bacterium]|nr:hypothetical protein [Candidatus Moranbacteria bacterium]
MKTLKKTSLFWDADNLDPLENKRFIIERVLDLGDVEDFNWIMSFYKEKEIRTALLKSKRISQKSANFWKIYFNINSKEWNKNQSQSK